MRMAWIVAVAACGLGTIAVSGCSGQGASGTGSEETATTVSQALAAGTGSVDYAHVKGVRHAPGAAGSAPTDADCRQSSGSPCYSPAEMQKAYGVSALLADGVDGRGQTIVIVDSFGTPSIEADLRQFDADYGLPDPPSFQVIAPLGTVPFDPNNSDMQGWAFETTLDVEWAHAMAPGASIVLLTSPVSETEGTVGMPQFLALETYALEHHLGQVISQSWSATENTLFDDAGRQVVAGFERMYRRARAQHVTVLASAGDSGAANQEQDGKTYYPFATVGYPASSPLVTSVGGTALTASVDGTYQSEVVWDQYGAGGGGVSQMFGEPLWELALPPGVQKTLAGHRGLPDVSYNASPATSILVYVSFPGLDAGYYSIGGTSEGSPQWAGIVADFDQLAGRPLGFLNARLYLLGELGLLQPLMHDITVGDNSYRGVTGYDATTGWDPASGWGTPSLAALGQLLAGLPENDASE